MSFDEIKEALECCSDVHFFLCDECPLKGRERIREVCQANLCKEALDLIEEYEKEIKRLKKEEDI